MSNQEKWDLHFLDICLVLAHKSRDNSLGVGCVIVGPDREIRSTGYNGLPRGVEHKLDRLERPEKYIWTEHAERNAVYNAARFGAPIKGCTAYVACTDLERGGHVPCVECSRAFIQAGIIEIVEYYVEPVSSDSKRSWTVNVDKAVDMLNEAGIVLRHVHKCNN